MTLSGSEILLGVLVLPLLLGFVRLVRGPSLPDRVVALDFITAVAVAASGVWAIATGNPVFLDVAMVLALISFVGTVAFARYLERRGRR
ncbi:MAG: cation:proton antiporter [Candidatus Sulfomarinibacteraceae bacterium]